MPHQVLHCIQTEARCLHGPGCDGLPGGTPQSSLLAPVKERIEETHWNKGRSSSSLCEKERTLVLSLFSVSPCWGRRKEASPQRCNPPTPSLRLIPAVAASVPLRTPYSVLCRGSGFKLQLGGPEEREREGERERRKTRRERGQTAVRAAAWELPHDERRSADLIKQGHQANRERENTPLTQPPTHASSSLWSFTLTAQPISREPLINTHATSLQPVTSSARISVLKDNLTPVWVATTMQWCNLDIYIMADMKYSILT